MAQVRLDSVLKAFRGKLGGFVFRQMKDGSVRVSVLPNFSRRKFSKGQKEHQQRFREASAYARDAARCQRIYAELAKGTTKTAYNIALSDWFYPPVIHRILVRDGKILIEASDNVMVAKVEITVSDEKGHVIEKGEGVRVHGDWWEYLPERNGKTITAAAWDLAGNVTKADL